MKTQCMLEISNSGHSATILAKNGRIIAQFLVHGPLAQCTENAVNDIEISNGRANIFRGELFGLPAYEYLDMIKERIIEK